MVRWRGLLLLGVLYVAQGMPFGFQARALPLYLAEADVSIEAVGLTGLLSLPWLFKWAWAPLVERGSRRRWLVAMQLVLLGLIAAAGSVSPQQGLAHLGVILLLMNLVTATQDIAVDGAAIDLLSPADLGRGNAVQVGGYKLGMLIAGGLVPAFASDLGWSGGFAVMGAVVAISLAAALRWREPAVAVHVARTRRQPLEVVRTLLGALRRPGHRWVVLVVATYKLGESLSDLAYKQWLIRVAHWPKEEVALWLSLWGMVPSIAGSLLGGWWASRATPERAIAGSAVLRFAAIAAFVAIAALGPSVDPEVAIAASWFEELAGGALTTAMFAFMMARVDRRIGATHFTALASIEVAGKAPGGIAGGFIIAAVGWPGAFTIAATASVLFLPLLWLTRPRTDRD